MSICTWISWCINSINSSRLLTWSKEISHFLIRWIWFETSGSLFGWTASRIYLWINSGSVLRLRILHLIHNSRFIIQPASTSSVFISGAHLIEKFWNLRALGEFRKLTELSVANIRFRKTFGIIGASVIDDIFYLRTLTIKI